MSKDEAEVKMQQEFPCNFCNKVFKQSLQLKIHQKKKHKMLEPAQLTLIQNNVNDTSSSSFEQTQEIKPVLESTTLQNPSNKGELQLTQQTINDQRSAQGKLFSQKPISQPTTMPNSCLQPQSQLTEQGQPAVVIPVPPPVTPTDDIYQKIYLCGCNNKFFQLKQELTLHIKKQHLGFPPDGTLIGVSKQLIIRQFKPTQQTFRPTYTPRQPYQPRQKHLYRFVCGCGARYPQFQALGFHVKKRHEGIEPEGTRGGLLNPPLELFEDDVVEPQISISQSSNNQNEQVGKICVMCKVECLKRSWVCKECKKWKVCGKCVQGNISKETHIRSGHRVYTC